MQTITLKLSDDVVDKFKWLLKHFSKSEVEIIDSAEYNSEDEYLRSIKGMHKSLLEAREEPTEYGKSEKDLEW